MKRPLISIGIFFIVGILTAACINCAFPLIFIFLLSAFIFLIFFIRRYFLFLFFLFLTSFFLGACLLTNAKILPFEHIERLTPYAGKRVILRGIVSDEPVQKKKKLSFVIQSKELIMDNLAYKVTGNVLVDCYRNVKIDYGQEVILNGKLYQPFSFKMAEKLNYRDLLRKKGIYAMFSISKHDEIIFTGKNNANPVKKTIIFLLKKAKNIIHKYLSSQAAGVINAMILGCRNDVPQFINRSLQKTGTVHILAVSGLHVGMLAVIVMTLLKMLRVPCKLSCLVAIFILCAYCMLSGCRTSVVRATIMSIIFLLAHFLERDYEPYSALSLAAIIILWANPQQLFDLGFQLSFISVISIFAFTKKVLNIFPEKMLDYKWTKILLGSFSISFSAWIGTLGIVAYYFNIITPVAVLANIIIVPLLFIIVTCGFIFMVLSIFFPAAAVFSGLTCEFFITLLYKINSFFTTIPCAYIELPNCGFNIVIFYYLLIILFFNAEKLKQLRDVLSIWGSYAATRIGQYLRVKK